MKFSEEKVTRDLLEESAPLLHKHWEEVSFYRDIPLNPDYEQYLLMENLGVIKAFTVRTGDDKRLVGYAVFFLKNHVHYKNVLYAIQDIIFVSPACRGIGMYLIKFCEVELKKIGVKVIMHHIKLSHDWSGALMKLGYEKQDVILTKRLDIE